MGMNKALLPLGGQPMIAIAARTMREVFAEVSIIADHEAPYRFLGLPVIPDLIARSGPLGGIHAALVRHAPGGVFVIACDTPGIPADLIRMILGRRGTGGATIARHAGRVHPLCGIYEHRALPAIEASLRAGRLKILDLLGHVETSYVEITPELPSYHPGWFDNINDPRQFRRRAAQSGS